METSTNSESETASEEQSTNTVGDVTDESLINDVIPNASYSAEYLTPFGFEHSPDAVETRMNNAESVDRPVYPDGLGRYRLPEIDGSDTYLVNLDVHDSVYGNRASCGCPDYNYNAADDGFDCKHILYVKLLIAGGYLPPKDVQDVDRWMLVRIQLFERFLKDKIESTISSVIESELREVLEGIQDEKTEPAETNLRDLERQVADALLTE